MLHFPILDLPGLAVGKAQQSRMSQLRARDAAFPASPWLWQHLHLDRNSYELQQPFVTTAAAHSCSLMEKGPFWWSHVGALQSLGVFPPSSE